MWSSVIKESARRMFPLSFLFGLSVSFFKLMIIVTFSWLGPLHSAWLKKHYHTNKMLPFWKQRARDAVTTRRRRHLMADVSCCNFKWLDFHAPISRKKTFHSRNQVKWLEFYRDLYFKVTDCRYYVHFIWKSLLFYKHSESIGQLQFDSTVEAIKLQRTEHDTF